MLRRLPHPITFLVLSSVSLPLTCSPITSVCLASFPASYLHLQIKVGSIHSLENLLNRYWYSLWFGAMPRAEPCSASLDTMLSVFPWNTSKGSREGGNVGLKYFQVSSLQIRVSLRCLIWNSTKAMSKSCN